MTKGILLDLDNTLYEYAPCHKSAMERVFAYITEHAQISADVFKREFDAAKEWVKMTLPETASSHNRLLYMQRLCEQLSLSAATHALHLYELYWNTFMSRMRLSEDAKVFLERYKNVPICLVTDLTSHIQYRKIKALGLNRWIDYIVTSEEAGHEKPHPFMFQLGMSKLGLRSDSVCMVGDSFKKDAMGAAYLGVQSFWYTRFISLPGEEVHSDIIKEIHSLEEIDW